MLYKYLCKKPRERERYREREREREMERQRERGGGGEREGEGGGERDAHPRAPPRRAQNIPTPHYARPRAPRPMPFCLHAVGGILAGSNSRWPGDGFSFLLSGFPQDAVS